MENEKDLILEETRIKKEELTIAESRLNDLSKMTYDQIDAQIDKIDTMVGVKATLKIYGKVLLALIKIIKRKLY